MVWGSVGVSLALILLGWTEEIVAFLVPESGLVGTEVHARESYRD